ncbi:inositol hexakisphosphate and diphosphoinositol-pentakisphosphate kinase [Basidiobolus ranarum]|uniref:Inositol hexakisphosphate and diphosphoinositol-pentakisphosphate kinase n=1 Tax=Basidiobolus ranarum TaxID=34480 RepID=A0ABR2W4K8_9FUNG
MSSLFSSSPHFFQFSAPSRKLVIGVCALDTKTRSKPMRNILNRLLAYEEFETVIFGDKVILDEDVENWPYCDFLISFFSTGFPLDTAVEYVKLRKPFCVNDLPMQHVLFDRRLVLSILDAIKVPTPRRLVIHRDGGPQVPADVADRVYRHIGLQLNENIPDTEVDTSNSDIIDIMGETMLKPFVEKPANGEDHNIYIYYSKEQGGGVRRLFRKIGNKSSEYRPEMHGIRTDGSYIYEEFVDVLNSEDVKVYTIGPSYAHAETRKSPVVDGIVRRNADGKEVRYITNLSPEEKEMVKKVCIAFGQNICGIDLLRTDGKSYVIDVNGWSFVKGNDNYYDMCVQILRRMFLNAAKKRWFSHFLSRGPNNENAWTLKGFLSVFRHGDRTPKQKVKFTFTSQPFISLLKGSTRKIILKKDEELLSVIDASNEALALGIDDTTKLEQLKLILENKYDLVGTKVQLKPSFNKKTGHFETLILIVKWGGEFTHAGLHHTKEVAENMRNDLAVLNKKLFDDVRIYSSSERRVVATAEVFGRTFLDTPQLEKGLIQIRGDMLDDSDAAKEPIEQAKRQIVSIMKTTTKEEIPELVTIPKEIENISEFLKETVDLLSAFRSTMHDNFANMEVEHIQKTWCCSETPGLFKERWEKIFQDICDPGYENFNPSKVPELYDSLKYDALHNREFLEVIFVKPEEHGQIEQICELYYRAKILFDIVAPQEFGITADEKMEIGSLTSIPLLNQIVGDLEDIRNGTDPSARFYFTKESQLHTMLNVVFGSGLPTKLTRADLEELDYLTQITFELYECNRESDGSKEYSLRVGFSPGAHHANIMDLQMDDRHTIFVSPRRDLTHHLALDRALQYLHTQIDLAKQKDAEMKAGVALPNFNRNL